MKRSVLVAIVLSLFMFQSLWNVAAAFCTHETPTTPVTSVYHFGHHADTPTDHRLVANDQNTEYKKLEKTSNYSIVTDHHDHIFACHVMLAEGQKDTLEPKLLGDLTEPKYDWYNFYQSPQLVQHNPPPLSHLL